MERSGNGNSTSEKRAIPRYGLSNLRKLNESKTKVGATGDQVKSTSSSATVKNSHSFIKIPTPTKIAKPCGNKDVKDKDNKDSTTLEIPKEITSKENIAKEPILKVTESKEDNTLKEAPVPAVKDTAVKPVSARTSATKIWPGRQQTARQVSANRILLPARGKTNSDLVKPTAGSITRPKLTTLTTSKAKPATPRMSTSPVELSAKHKSVSLHQIDDSEHDSSLSHQSLQQKLNAAFTAQIPVPSLDIGDAKSVDAQSTATDSSFKKSVSAIKRKSNVPPYKGRDFRKYGSFDSVQTLGRSEKDALPHAVTGRDRVMENKKFKVFEAVEKQLETLQSDFMNKYEGLKATSPDKLKNSYRFITMVKDNECKLIVSKEDLFKLPKKIPASSLSHLKETIRDALYANLSKCIEQFKQTRPFSTAKIDEIRDDMDKFVVARLDGLYHEIDLMCEPRANDPEMELIKLKRELQESEKNIQILERKMAEVKKLHQEEKEALEVALMEKSNTALLTKDTTISELTHKLRKFEKDYECMLITLNDQENTLKDKETQLERMAADLKEIQQKLVHANTQIFEIETERNREKDEKRGFADKIDALENMLQVSKTELEDMKQQLDIKLSADNDKLTETISTLNTEVQTLKRHLTDSNHENASLKKQLEKFEMDHVRYGKMREEYLASKKRIGELESCVEALKQANIEVNVDEVHVLKAEIEKLRASESEKRRDIDKLKMDLAKEHYIKLQLEDHIKKDEELLDARANLINDLQTNELNNRQRCEALMVQNAEKHRTIHELNSELQSKSQEFRQLQESLREKCEALSRQEHMIRMLEQSNERNQKLRIKYEEKIARLEAEKRHLKDTIDLYSQNLVATNLRTPAPQSGRQSPRQKERQQPQHHDPLCDRLATPTATNNFTTTTATTTTTIPEFGDTRQATASVRAADVPAWQRAADAVREEQAEDSDSSFCDFQEIRNTRHLPIRQRDNRIFVRKYEK